MQAVISVLHDHRSDVIPGLNRENLILWFKKKRSTVYPCCMTRCDIWHWQTYRSILYIVSLSKNIKEKSARGVSNRTLKREGEPKTIQSSPKVNELWHVQERLGVSNISQSIKASHKASFTCQTLLTKLHIFRQKPQWEKVKRCRYVNVLYCCGPGCCLLYVICNNTITRKKLHIIHLNNFGMYPGYACISRQVCDMQMELYETREGEDCGHQVINTFNSSTDCLVFVTEEEAVKSLLASWTRLEKQK